MPIDPLTVLFLTLLGGAVAVDGTSFGQFMISRPFVAATIGGFMVGAPFHGATIGLILEAFHLTVLPVGAARYPEGGPAAVAGGAVYGISDVTPSALLLTVLGALLLEWVGGETVRMMRHGNVKLISDDHGPRATARGLERRHLAAVGVDFLRGMFLVAAGMLLLRGVDLFMTPLWGFGEELPRLMIVAAVPALLASTLRMVGWRMWFAAAGAITGVSLLLLVG
ncbi:MAG: PTS sugar transporter subunit IIC [Gemmatimonadota bacterium]